MLRDISADERVEPACRHAQFAGEFCCRNLAGFIGCVGHQDVVAPAQRMPEWCWRPPPRRRTGRARIRRLQFTHGFTGRKVSQRSPASVK